MRYPNRMEFTSDIQKEILGYLAGNGKTPSGQACRFMTVGEIGVKVYGKNAEKAQGAFENQKRAADLGLAPAVGEFWTIRLRLGPYDHICIYGYLTEIADVIDESGYGGGTLTEEEEIELGKRLEANGFPAWDIYGRNVGRLKDGRAVCIDFDPVSMDASRA